MTIPSPATRLLATLLLATTTLLTAHATSRTPHATPADAHAVAAGTAYTLRYISPEDKQQGQFLWYGQSPEGYPRRIPAITTTRTGDLVAVADERPCGADIGFGEVDLLSRYSINGGLTWSTPVRIADGDGSLKDYPYFGKGFGDAALVADRGSDEVLIMCVSGCVPYPYATADKHPCVARLRSHDGGRTWDKPQDVTSNFWGRTGESIFAPADSSVVPYGGFFGSGRIVQSRVVKKGKYHRLYAAMLCRGKAMQGAYVVYSDDFGESWHALGGDPRVQACPGSDEPKVEELPGGDIVLSGRKWYGRWFNVWRFASDDFTTGRWDQPVASDQAQGGIRVGANSCNGEILLVPATNASTGAHTHILLQSLPTGNGRTGVSIYYKEVTASTPHTAQALAQDWHPGLQIVFYSSAYSTMTLQHDGRIGFMLEQAPTDYSLFYQPLTLEAITHGAYSVRL